MDKTDYLNQIQPYMERSIVTDNKNSTIGIGRIDRTSTEDFYINQKADAFHFSIFIEGSGIIVHEGTDVATITPPCIYQFKESDIYSLIPAPGSRWTEFCLRIDADIIASLKKVGLLPPLYALIPADANPLFYKWMSELSRQIHAMPVETLPELFFDIQRFLIAICNTKDSLPASPHHYLVIAEAKQMIRNAVANQQPINSQILSANFNIPMNQFTKIFKQYTGMSPAQYVMHFKIHYAERLLDTGMSVKETASTLGYADPFIFSKQFKKITGKSPKEHRKLSTDN